MGCASSHLDPHGAPNSPLLPDESHAQAKSIDIATESAITPEQPTSMVASLEFPTCTTSLHQPMKTSNMKAALLAAIKKDDMEGLALLMSTHEGILSLNETIDDENGWKTLHAAVIYSTLDTVRFLVEKGADIETLSGDGGGTPLSYAAMAGRERIAEYLLSKGASKEMAIKKADSDVVENFFAELESVLKQRPELVTRREELKVKMKSSERPETLPTTCKGITIGGLRKMKLLIQSECEAGRFKEDKSFPDGTHCKGTMNYEELTTTDIVYRYVKDEAVTGDRRFSDTGTFSSEFFTAPSLFISHAWKGRFFKLADEVLAYAQKSGLSDDYAVWMDMWAVNQHYSNDFSKNQNHDDVMAFQEVLQTCLNGTLVVCDFEKCETQSRAWCLFEWDWTMYYHGREALQFTGLSKEEAEAGREGIDVEKAECFKAEDKEMILREIMNKHGSTDNFNTKLQIKWELVSIGQGTLFE
jgi:hypothetical protein